MKNRKIFDGTPKFEISESDSIPSGQKTFVLFYRFGPDKRADVLIDLMGYLYPKRKALDQRIEVESKAALATEVTSEEREERKVRIAKKLQMLRQLDGCKCPSKDFKTLTTSS